jgi:hypothetical protein
MADMLSNIGLVVTQIVTWVGNVATMITTTPILLFTVGFLAIGGAVGIFGRLLSRN